MAESLSQNVLPLFFDNLTKNIEICFITEIIDELQFLNKETTLKDVISYLNTSLNSGINRLSSLLLLDFVIQQSPGGVFISHGLAWSHQLHKIIQARKQSREGHAACLVLSNLLRQAVHFPELSRHISLSLMPTLLQTLGSFKPQKHYSVVQCVTACLECFPGACGNLKIMFENRSLSSWNTEDKKLLQSLVTCLAHMPGAGGCGNNGINYKEAWTIQINKMISWCNNVIDQLYGNLLPVSQYMSDNVLLDPENPPIMEPKRTLFLHHRLEFLCSVIMEMLRLSYNCTIQIPVSALLTLICKICQVNSKTLSCKTSIEMIILTSVIPAIHTSALRLLESLITSYSRYLVPYNNVINKLFVQSLSWTSNKANTSNHQQKAYRSLRCLTYSVLQHWIEANKNMSGIHRSVNHLLPHIISDIQPETEVVKLSNKPLRDITFKKKKKSYKLTQLISNSLEDTTILQRKQDPLANYKVCRRALTAIKVLLIAAGTSLSTGVHKEIQEFVLKLIPKLQQKEVLCPPPYRDAKSRLGVYSILLACITTPIPKSLLFCQQAKSSFIKGQLDINFQVRTFCLEALVTSAGMECQVFISNLPSLETLASGNIEQPPVLTQHQITELQKDFAASTSTPPVEVERKRKFEDVDPSEPAKKPSMECVKPKSLEAVEETMVHSEETMVHSEEIAEQIVSYVNTEEIPEQLNSYLPAEKIAEQTLTLSVAKSSDKLPINPLKKCADESELIQTNKVQFELASTSQVQPTTDELSEEDPEVAEMLKCFVDRSPDPE